MRVKNTSLASHALHVFRDERSRYGTCLPRRIESGNAAMKIARMRKDDE